MKNILLSLVIAIVLSSCTEEKIVTVEVEKENSWKEITRLTSIDKIILTSSTGKNSVYFYAPGNIIEIRLENGEYNTLGYINRAGFYDLDYIIPINDGIYINHFGSFNISKLGGFGSLHLDFINVDPDYSQILTPQNSFSENYKINKSKVALVHYGLNNNDDHFNFLLITIDESYDFDDNKNIDLSFVKKIKINKTISFGSNELWDFYSFNDYFIIYILDQGLYKLHDNGYLVKVLDAREYDHFHDMFEYDNKLHFFDVSSRFESIDEGLTWNEYELPYTQTRDFMITSQFYNVADSLVGANGDQIYTLSMNKEELVVTTLKNDGLEHRHITAIEVLGDNVYVGTMSGLFVKPLSSFFEVNELEEN